MALAASVGDEFTDLLGSVVAIAVKVIIFLIIMALGWFIARWLHTWTTRTLRRVGYDRAVERGGLRRMLGTNTASELTGRLVVFAFMLFVLQLAFGIFGPNAVSDLIGDVIAWLPKLFVAVVIVVVAAAIAGWLRDLIAGALGGLSYGRTVATTAQVLIIALGLMAALNQIGVATSVTLPILIAGLAIVTGILVVGVGGGLIKPMQHRWERMLDRAETETSTAAEKVRAHRAANASAGGKDRDTNPATGFDQPAYAPTGDISTTDRKPDATRTPAETDTETGTGADTRG